MSAFQRNSFIINGLLLCSFVLVKLSMAELRRVAIEWISKNESMIIDVSNKIWEYAETGLQEFKSSRLLADTAENHEFKVERSIADMPTAFVATYGSGSPTIGILGEFDALAGLSQKAVPYREPVKEGAPGHGCGHNLYGTAGMAAAIAVKEAIEKGKLKGTVKFFGTPAEETVGGKVFMVRDGCFKGVDAVMGHHIGAANNISLRSTNAENDAKFVFHGIAAHAAMTPWQGRSALDAVELMDVGVNFMREHIVSEARIHYVIHNGGSQPNVVPEKAGNWFYIRAPERSTVKEIYDWVLDIAEGAAKMTQTKCEIRFTGGMYNMIPNRTLAELLVKNMKEIGAPTYTNEELEFARKIGEQVSAENRKNWGYRVPGHEDLSPDVYLDSRILDPWGEGEVEAGGTDEADVSWNAPLVELNTGSRVVGAPGHSWMNVAVAGTSIGHKNLIFAAKTMANSALDMLAKPEILKAAWDEFTKRKKGKEYKSPLPPDLKPLDLFH